MNALVDDLFTFPLGSADGDGGDTKVHLITGGQTWSLGNSFLLDSSFGVSLFDQFCSSPDFQLGNLGLEPRHSGHERSGTKRRALRRQPGIQDGIHGAREHANLEPGLARGEDRLLQQQRDQGRRQS